MQTRESLGTAEAQAAQQQIQALETEVRRVIVGQRQVVSEVLIALLAAGHVLIEGLPGLGKTLLVRSIAQAVGGKFARIQFTADLMPADISGHAIFDQKSETFRIRRGPVFCNFLLGDEINRAPAKTQAALLESMQEQQVTIEGRSHPLTPPFVVLATQNPIEQEGTYALPQAQLDRFMLNVLIDYPAHDEEVELAKRVTGGSIGDQLDLDGVQEVLRIEQMISLQEQAARVSIDGQIFDYAARIARATRQHGSIELGAGPRATIALLRAARGQALYNGHDFITPDDVKQIAPAVLRHRIKLTTDQEIEGVRNDAVIAALLQEVEAPRQ